MCVSCHTLNQHENRGQTDKGNANDTGGSKDDDKTNNKGGFLSRTLYRPKPSAAGANGNARSSGSKPPNIPPKSGAGGNAKNGGWGGMGGRRSSGGVRRPADGRAPGRRDPAAVARLEAEAAARAKAEKEELDGRVDLSWQLPANVDYYSAPGGFERRNGGSSFMFVAVLVGLVMLCFAFCVGSREETAAHCCSCLWVW